jgi:hypothetical protein
VQRLVRVARFAVGIRLHLFHRRRRRDILTL